MISSSGETEIRVAASPDGIRAVLGDAAALGRIIPGCESAETVGPGRFRLVLATRVGFLTVRADVDATLRETGTDGLELVLDGDTHGFDGGFLASIPFTLAAGADGTTTVRYEVSVATRGTVALAGDAAVASAIHELADELVGGLEREATGR